MYKARIDLLMSLWDKKIKTKIFVIVILRILVYRQNYISQKEQREVE